HDQGVGGRIDAAHDLPGRRGPRRAGAARARVARPEDVPGPLQREPRRRPRQPAARGGFGAYGAAARLSRAAAPGSAPASAVTAGLYALGPWSGVPVLPTSAPSNSSL